MMPNFRTLLQKYANLDDKERRLMKRKVHSKSYGSRYGTLVAFGKLWKNITSNNNSPIYKGPVVDVNTGTEYHVSIWDNGGSARIEICKKETL